MQYNHVNEFGWSLDNFGSTWTDAGFGALISGSASANGKGQVKQMITGSSVSNNVYGISIGFSGGNTAGAVRMFLVDLMVDRAGGTNWEKAIGDLVVNCPSLLLGGYWYYFPLFFPSGTSFGLREQCSTANITMRGGIGLFGLPSHPELVKVGSFVRTFGMLTGSSNGIPVTPGSSAIGSYNTGQGQTADDLWFWQVGLAINDTSQTAVSYSVDVAGIDASNKELIMEKVKVFANNTNEQTGKEAFGNMPPYRMLESGSLLYTRVACSGTPDSSISTVVYGVGG